MTATLTQPTYEANASKKIKGFLEALEKPRALLEIL
jgi:hypothetical protein